MMDDDESWNRLPGEPMRWFARFHTYLLMQPRRSVLALYKAERLAQGRDPHRVRSVPGSWRAAATRYRWTARAEAWDTHQLEQQAREELEFRRHERAQFLAMTRAARQLMGQRLEQYIRGEVTIDIPWDRLVNAAYRNFLMQEAIYNSGPQAPTPPPAPPVVPVPAPTHRLNYQALTDEEWSLWKELLAKIRVPVEA